MRRYLCCAVLLLLAAPVRPDAQAPPARDPGPIFRLSVSLVQLDAVVTDRHGRHVTNLGPDDFIVLQDGKAQPVTAVAYIRADEPLLDERGDPIESPPVSPRDARRVVAVIVDDSRMSFESIAHVRTALRRFVDEQLQPDDLVTIVTTSGAPGTTWPFTYSRAELRAAASRLRYSIWNETASNALEPLNPTFGLGPSPIDSTRERIFAIGALNRIADVVRAVRVLPGRKTIVLVSEGFAMFGEGDQSDLIRDAMRRLVDRANRAGVVVYAVDPRGLVVTGLTAADNTAGVHDLAAVMSRRSEALLQTQDGLRYVAGQTGGFAVVNNNDIRGALGRVMDDQRGYYLIGYQPAAATFGANGQRPFRTLRVKVTRRGLKVRTRAGFYAIPTE